MQQFINALAVAVALYPILVASAMHKVRRSPSLTTRDDPVMPTIINITTTNGVATKRDEPPVGYYYYLIGCVDEVDNYPVRTLTHQIVDWNEVGVGTCVEACFNEGPIDGPFGAHYIFSGVVNGNQCWCDNAINIQAPVVDLSRCNHVCANGDELCGGSREYQMYYLGQTGLNPFNVNPTFEASTGIGSGQYNYQGCFADNTSNRALTGWSYADDNVTPHRCAEKCWEQNYTWAGVEYGRECWCGNTNNAAGAAVDLSNCAQACSGDSTKSCGAPGYIDMYQSGSPPRSSIP